MTTDGPDRWGGGWRGRRGGALALLLTGLLVALGASGEGVLPTQRSLHYAGLYALPLEDRILPAPEPVLQLAWLGNRRAGVDLWPTPAGLDHPLVPELRSMIQALPEPVYRLASRYLAGIFIVERTFGSARAEGLWDAGDRLVGGYMLLNLTALARSANAWATMREGSAFHSANGTTIQVLMEPPETDTPQSALRFIFLHELGHVLGMGMGVHGHWAVPATFAITGESPFTRKSWRGQGADGPLAPAKLTFPLLTQLRFYRFEEAPLPRTAAPLVYQQLAHTDFPSLYGTLDPYEDFAETFALYVHTRLLGKPYAVVVAGENGLGVYRSCLQTGGCPTKALFIERLLATPP